jgi:hypothetical protein
MNMLKTCRMYVGTGKFCGNHFTLNMFHSFFVPEKKYVLFILSQQHMLNIAFYLRQDMS